MIPSAITSKIPKYVSVNNFSFFIILFFAWKPLHAQVDYFGSDNIYRFAQYLFDNQDYVRAAGEFERYLYKGSPKSRDVILFKIGKCHRLSGHLDKSIGYLQKIIDDYPKSSYRIRSQFEISHVYTKEAQFDKSISYINNFLPELFFDHDRIEATQLIGMNYLYLRRWKDADHLFSSLSSGIPGKETHQLMQLKNIALEGTKLPYKSKLTAGLLSTFIPGSGKVYARRRGDGIYTILLFGLNTWQAYKGFQDNGLSSRKGWIYGTIAGGLYLGNIYGTMVSVRIFNDALEQDLVKRVRAIDQNYR